jgi:hypothetical protein
VKVTKASCKVRFRKFLGGSVLKGTVFNRWDGVDTHLALESDAPPETLAHLIRNAKNGCFAEGLITQSVPLNTTDRSERQGVRARRDHQDLIAGD